MRGATRRQFLTPALSTLRAGEQLLGHLARFRDQPEPPCQSAPVLADSTTWPRKQRPRSRRAFPVLHGAPTRPKGTYLYEDVVSALCPLYIVASFYPLDHCIRYLLPRAARCRPPVQWLDSVVGGVNNNLGDEPLHNTGIISCWV